MQNASDLTYANQCFTQYFSQEMSIPHSCSYSYSFEENEEQQIAFSLRHVKQKNQLGKNLQIKSNRNSAEVI